MRGPKIIPLTAALPQTDRLSLLLHQAANRRTGATLEEVEAMAALASVLMAVLNEVAPAGGGGSLPAGPTSTVFKWIQLTSPRVRPYGDRVASRRIQGWEHQRKDRMGDLYRRKGWITSGGEGRKK